MIVKIALHFSGLEDYRLQLGMIVGKLPWNLSKEIKEVGSLRSNNFQSLRSKFINLAVPKMLAWKNLGKILAFWKKQ